MAETLIRSLSCLTGLLFLIYLSPGSLQADELLEGVLETVVEKHPQILMQLERINAARGLTRSARGAFDTTLESDSQTYASGFYSGARAGTQLTQPLEPFGIDVFSGYRVGAGTFPVYEEEYATKSGGEVFGGLRVPLLRDSAIDSRRGELELARLGEELAGVNFERQRVALLAAAAAQYWRWVAKGLEVQVRERLLEVAKLREKQIAYQVEKGEVPKFDHIDSERAVFQRRGTLDLERASLVREQGMLGVFVGADPSQEFPLELPKRLSVGVTSLRVGDNYSKEVMNQLPEMRRLRTMIAQVDVEKDLTENQILPEVDLVASLNQDIGDGSETRDDLESKIGLRISFPLQNRAQKGKRESLRAKQREVQHRLTLLEQELSTKIDNFLFGLKQARKSYNSNHAELSAASKLEEGERKRFASGDSSLFIVNIREQDAAEARIRVLKAALQYRKLETELAALFGYGASGEIDPVHDFLSARIQ